MRKRPVSVTVVAMFAAAATVLSFLVATSLLHPGTVLDEMWELNKPAIAVFKLHRRLFGSALAALGLVNAATTVGLLRGRMWARQLAIAVFAVSGIGDVVALVIARDWLRSGSGALIAAAFIFLLLRPEVRSYFAAG